MLHPWKSLVVTHYPEQSCSNLINASESKAKTFVFPFEKHVYARVRIVRGINAASFTTGSWGFEESGSGAVRPLCSRENRLPGEPRVTVISN